MRMMRGVAATLEKHHQVQLLDEAIEAAVKLSHRYIPARQLPDKAVSVLDTACARVAVSQHATPAAVEDCQRQHRSARDRAGDHRARGERRHRHGRARAPRPAEARRRSRRARRSWRRAWPRRRRWSMRSWRCAAAARRAGRADRGSRRGLGRRRGAGRARRSRRASSPSCSSCRPSSTELQGDEPLILPSVDEQAVAVGGRRLDRHPGRPHGQGRDRRRAAPRGRRSSSG